MRNDYVFYDFVILLGFLGVFSGEFLRIKKNQKIQKEEIKKKQARF